MKYELLEARKKFIIDVRVIPENDKEIFFLEKYNLIAQTELEELDIIKFNEELVDFVEARGYKTRQAFDFPINNVCSARIVFKI
jgi:hypothetical protein